MDSFEISEAKKPPRRKRPGGRVWNILTVLVLVALLCVVSFFVIVYIDPNSILNPFPPPTMNPALATATFTVTPRFTLVPSWTPTSPSLQVTDTPSPSDTPLGTSNIIINPTSTEPHVVSISSNYAFELQQGSPTAIPGTDFHPDAGCNWSGIAGQATSLNGEAVRGLFVQLGGSLPGAANVDNLVMTGLASQYGQGGFEITLANQLVASAGTLWIQLLDQQNLPLSERIYFDTYDDCQKNLIIIYFSQVR